MKFIVVSAFPALVVALFAQTATAVAAPIKDCSKTDEWDAVVVGSGTAGSIVAAELATGSPDKCVLVLEAGMNSGQVLDEYDADKLPASHNNFFETGYKKIHESPETAWNTPGTYDTLNCWAGECDYGWNAKKRLTAKIVGGGSAINGALMQYPNPESWDAWPNGWKHEDMEPFLDEVEKTMNATNYPSADGLHYNDEHGPDVVKKAMKGIGFKESDDGKGAYFMPVANTMGIPYVCAKDGRRTSPASEYLAPALKQTNIFLWTEAEAKKIVLDDSATKATGIEVDLTGEDKTNKSNFIKLAENGLVVVSGGGIMSNELLVQSGIGPEGPKVKNDDVNFDALTDKIVTLQKFKVEGMKAYNLTNPTEEHQDLYITKRSGPLAQFGPLIVGFIDAKLDDTEAGKKNTVEFFVPATTEDNTVTVNYVHFTPKKSTIKGQQFDEDYTVASFKKAMNVVKEAMKNLDNSYEEVELDFGNGYGFPLHAMNHPAGMCEIGKCVDENTLMVKGGLTNLAVVDNSLLPEQAHVHSVFALMAIALRSGRILNNFWGEEPMQNDEL